MLETRVSALLASLAVHVEAWALTEPRSLVEAGEWGAGFETLCDNLYEAKIPLFPGEVAEIESLGRALNSRRRAWQLVRELVVE